MREFLFLFSNIYNSRQSYLEKVPSILNDNFIISIFKINYGWVIISSLSPFLIKIKKSFLKIKKSFLASSIFQLWTKPEEKGEKRIYISKERIVECGMNLFFLSWIESS